MPTFFYKNVTKDKKGTIPYPQVKYRTIIFQVGDKEFWEKQKIPRNNVEYVYEDILDYLQ